MGPKSNDCCPYRANHLTQRYKETHREDRARGAITCQKKPEASETGRSMERPSPKGFRGSMTSPTPWFWTSASRTGREEISVLNYSVVICYSSSRKLIRICLSTNPCQLANALLTSLQDFYRKWDEPSKYFYSCLTLWWYPTAYDFRFYKISVCDGLEVKSRK